MSSNNPILAPPESRRPGMMSSNSWVLARPESRRPGDEHRPPSRNQQGYQNWGVRVPRGLYHRMEENDGGLSPYRLFEERVRSGPYELARFPARPYSPARIRAIHGNGGGVSPGLRDFLANSPPRIRREWNLPGEEPGLTEEEFKTAMRKLKKEAYSPKKKTKTNTKTKTKPREGRGGASSSSSSSSSGGSNGGKGEEGEGMCTICLEVFAAGESVLVTPCDHVFHGDCVSPWVRSHGRCPLCRFELCERRSGGGGGGNGNGNGGDGEEEEEDDDVGLGLTLELVALLRAMEEALNWVGFSADVYRNVTIT